MDKEQSQGKKKRAEEESIEGASTSLFISPVPTDVGSGEYDVFLSFRGSDTRKAFTDHLYHSLIKAGTLPICVFRDDNSIPIGKEFGSQIFDAITRSKISIPIISENYSSSKWCLRELIHIMDCKKSMSHMVLPIFYKVDPSDVRYLKGSFGEAFHSRKKRFDEKDIKEGLEALREVSDLHGWESEKFADGHEGKLIEHVVETVTSKLQEDFQLVVPKQLVGLDGCLEEIMNWIDSPSIHARMIGIYGMGGIGKTTLAKHIYNQLSNKFVHASFLPDVRETTRRHGITYLQSQLISDILQSKSQVSRIDDGINIIKSRFKGKKVLILLDDIDDKNQLDALARESNWFMAGSMIIVTTRNEAVLDQSEFEVDYKYELNGLDEVHALLLFNIHAFHMDHSPWDFKDISRDIISTMGGLPLALQVVGSYLYKKTNRKVWEDVQKQLDGQPHKDVQKILQISYDALKDGPKQIFLDIACFFIGENSHYAMYMWEDCGFYPSQGIEELKLRCLIKIGDDGRFMMHDQLRDLGRSIFCQRQLLDKRSGPWDCNYRGASRVVWERKDPWFDDWILAASSGGSNELLFEVRWLRWQVGGRDPPLPSTNLHLPKLSWSNIKRRLQRICICRIDQCCVLGDDPPLPTTSLHLPNLSVLDLSFSYITEDWEGWRSSFMTAKRLQVLDLRWCHDLRRTTPDLSAFTQLKILTLSFCGGLEHLHPSVGKLRSLVSLDLSSCYSLKELPEEVGELKELEELHLDDSGITEIPTSIGSLRKLKTLRVDFCKSLREIPSSIGDLQNLRRLNLSGCESLKEIPEEVGELKDLEKLSFDHSGITGIPTSIGSLRKLRTLSAIHCKALREIPSSIGDLQNLQHLCLSYSGIEKLPSEIGDLSSVKNLEITCTPISDLPESIWNLSLQSLDLSGCNNLRSLPEFPSDLTDLSIQGYKGPRAGPWAYLIYRRKHHLKACHIIGDPELSSYIEFDQILFKLDGLKNLEELSIKSCSFIERLDLSQLIHLKRLLAVDCNNLVEIQGHDNLEFLEGIFLYDCNSIKRILYPESRCLTQLVAARCNNLVEIQGLDGAKFLETLDLTGCKSMGTLPDLNGCERFRSLVVQNCRKLTRLRGLENLDLIDLDISGCHSLKAIPKLSGTRVLRNYESELDYDEVI